MTKTTSTLVPSDEAVAWGAAYTLLAGALGAGAAALANSDDLATLRAALMGSEPKALDRLQTVDPTAVDPQSAARTWIKWFEQARIAPYECSNTPPSAGGHTAVLADVAGFYRAFGMGVNGERPDHVVAELEFMAFVSFAEAQARQDGDEEHAAVCRDAARTFLRDHLGRWLDAWALRVAEEPELAPWGPYALAAAELVRADARRHRVVPVLAMPLLDGGSLPLEDEAPLPECGADG
jgi:TorA maturation chaperone TorD